MSELSHQGAFRLIYSRRHTRAEQDALQSHLRHCAACRQDAEMAGLFSDHLVLKILPTRPSPKFTAVYMESAARRSRRSHIMKPIYAAGGAVALALLMLAGWFIIRSNMQTAGLVEAPQLPAVSIPEAQVTPRIDTAAGSLEEQLVSAVEAGDAAMVEQLLVAGANAHVLDSAGNAPLALAASEGRLEVVRLLLDAGADVDGTLTDNQGYNVAGLSRAAYNDHIDVVRLLINHGADVNRSETLYGRTALHGVSWSNNAEIVEILIENGADPNVHSTWGNGETPLHFAVRNGSVEAAQVLLANGAEVDIQTDLEVTPMMAAIKDHARGLPGIVSLLLEKGADPNLQDNVGNAALHLAARMGRNDVIPILIEHGASLDLQTTQGNTALHEAAKWDHAAVVTILIQYGADVTVQNNQGHTPLDIAASDEIREMLREAGATSGSLAKTSEVGEALIAAVDAGDTAKVERLLNAGADPNSVNGEGDMVLALAAMAGHLEIVQRLLDSGADVNSTATELYPAGQSLTGAPAIAHAAYGRHADVVALLIEYGADVNQQQEGSLETALHNAVWRSSPEIIKLLLDNGADPDLPTNNSWFPKGSTALHYAMTNGSLTSLQALLEGGADANVLTEQGQTLLMSAISQQFSTDQLTSFVTALLEAGTNPNSQDPDGNAALHYAIRADQNSLIPFLVENGAAVDLQNGEGDTPLHLAAQTNRSQAVSTLIDEGASVSIENNEGQTPLDIAANEEIGEILREAGAE